MQHRLPDHAVRTEQQALYCTECLREMKMTKAAATEPGRESRIYSCDCGHSERITVNMAAG
jgi:hypothetical protein